VANGADAELQINADGVGNDFVAAALITGGASLDVATLMADQNLLVS
jgi:hypothetical protein